MKKVPGLSYIELFVSMAIFAMLSLLAMPNFIGWRERETFKSQTGEIFQMINAARVNALTEHTCYNKNTGVTYPTLGWSLIFEHEQMTLRCHREGGFFEDEIIKYEAGLMINEYAMHYYNNHNYNKVFYSDLGTPYDLYRVNESGVRVNDLSENPSSLLIDFEPGTGECSLGGSPEIRGILLPMYLPRDAGGLKRFICLDRMAGMPYFCSDKYPAYVITTLDLTE